MKNAALLFAAVFALPSAWAAPAPAVAEPTAKDAIAMCERGVALVKAKGKEELAKRILAKDPEFVQGKLYVTLRDLNTGFVLAHAFNPSIIGKDLLEVPDVNGKKYRLEIVEMAKKNGKGWVDYHYRNPTTNLIEPKTTYFVKVDDVVLEAGIYKK
jgi:cytochrome c